MKPIHKYNNGKGATLCHKCRDIIIERITDRLYCPKCSRIMGTNNNSRLNKMRGKITDKTREELIAMRDAIVADYRKCFTKAGNLKKGKWESREKDLETLSGLINDKLGNI